MTGCAEARNGNPPRSAPEAQYVALSKTRWAESNPYSLTISIEQTGYHRRNQRLALGRGSCTAPRRLSLPAGIDTMWAVASLDRTAKP